MTTANTPPNPDNATALLEAARDGDNEAYESFVRAYHALVYQLCLVAGVAHVEAVEVVKETFAALYRQRMQFRGDRAPLPWLCEIALHKALAHCRVRGNPILSYEALPAGIGHGAKDPGWRPAEWYRQSPEVLATAAAAEVRQSFQALPMKYRMPLWLHDVAGFDDEATALILGLTLPTMKGRLHRARMEVRATLMHAFARVKATVGKSEVAS